MPEVKAEEQPGERLPATVSRVPAASIPEVVLRAGVQSAFALGWHIAELHYREDRGTPGTDHRLRQIGALDSGTRRRLLLAQISADLDALGVERQGPVHPLRVVLALEQRSVDPLENLEEIKLPAGAESEVNRLHLAILLRLTVKDFELGKAYGLGANLGQMVLEAYEKVRPDKHGAMGLEQARPLLSEVFKPDRVLELWSSIKDLKSRFPPYAADPVAATLWDWSKWARSTVRRTGGSLAAGTDKSIADRLHRQGQLWRALLSGERNPKDCLLFANYIDAASDMLRKYWSLAGRMLAREWGTLLLALLGIAFAVAILIVVQRLMNNLAASLAGVVAALGVSWAGVVAALKRAVRPAENALWETEMTAAIAFAINYVPALPRDSAILGLRGDDPRPSGPVVEGHGMLPDRRLGGLLRRSVRPRHGATSGSAHGGHT